MGTVVDRVPAKTTVERAVAERLGVDPRALAAFRIALASILLLDLLLRARDLRAHYTDAGVYPRRLLAEQYPTLSGASLHALSGDAWFQVALFVLAGGVALALLVGYRTRLATAASLVLLLSLHVRNPHVLSGGDSLLQHLLFWSLFLPLGARWSIDARRGGATRERLFTPASAGILLQVVLVYGVNAVLKHRSDRWLSGEAVGLVFGLDRFTVLLGNVLRDLPTVLWVANWAWLAALLAAPLLVVLTGRRRTTIVAVLATMHLGMTLTMHLGIFPLVSVVALLPFLPPSVWDVLERHRRTDRLMAAGKRALDALDRWLPRLSFSGLARLVPPRRAVQSVAAAALLGVLVFNALGLGLASTPAPVADAIDGDRPDPRWVMFAHPPETDRWYVAPARLSSGERVDALGNGPVRWAKPDDVTRTYTSARARKYLNDALRDERLQPAFAASLCDRWNRSHETDLANVSLYAVETPSSALAADGRERIELASASCGSKG